MQTLEKYETFEDLKSNKKKASDHELGLKKSNAFEKVIKSLKPVKAYKIEGNPSK